MHLLGSLSLIPGPTAVSEGLGWLAAIAGRQQWPARTVFKLELSLDEVLNNIVMYGFEARVAPCPPPLITLSIRAGEQTLVIEIIDNGAAFDPVQRDSSELPASLDDAEMGGHGLRLVQHYMENIEYRHTNGCNHLTLTVAIDAPES